MMYRPLIVIPARGGSKGIPRKNIVELCGRPLLAYTIDAALSVYTPERILLSTDSEEIALVAESLGLATDYRRPVHLATDTASSRDVILDAMRYAESIGIEFDCVVLLQPTSPLRTSEDIRNAISLYDSSLDMVVSVCESPVNPYYNCFELNKDGFLHVSKGDGNFTRRQDVPVTYIYNGAVYVINPQSIKAMSLGDFSKRLPYVMPRERSIDIDEPLDLVVAENLLNKRLKNE